MRIDGWQRELNQYIVDKQAVYADIGYQPGQFDCVTFGADWCLKLTGVDPLADYRGQYATEDEAFALVEAREGSLQDALANRFPAIHPAQALRGDLAFIEPLRMCGIVFTVGGRFRALFLGDGGFSMRRAQDVAKHGCCFAVR